jgi:hypothetical protein
MAIASCGAESEKPEAAGDFKKTVEDPSPDAEEVADKDPQALEITAIHAPDTDAYCTLTQTGHSFVYDDPDSWKFVFLSEATGTPPQARIRINGDILTFEEADRTTNDEGIATWHYRSVDRGILVELKLRETSGGAGYSDYTGTMSIIEPAKTEKMGIEGSCGV